MQDNQTQEYNQGRTAGQAAYQLCSSLDINQQVSWAQKDFSETPIDESDSTGEKRSDFMRGFASRYYRASQQ